MIAQKYFFVWRETNSKEDANFNFKSSHVQYIKTSTKFKYGIVKITHSPYLGQPIIARLNAHS